MFFDRTMASVSQLYSDQGKLKFSDWYTEPAGIQHIGNELYPAYYNKLTGVTNAKLTFDRVSQKKATDCTPPAARIDINVTKTTDPFTKQDVITAPDGYNADASDDVHACSDALPTVSISVSGHTATVTYTHGTFALQSVSVQSGSTTIASKNVSANGTFTLNSGDLGAAQAGPLTATITDTGYYTASDSANYSP